MTKDRLLVVGGVCVLVGLAYVAGKRTNPEGTARAETPPAPTASIAPPMAPAPTAAPARGPFDMSGLDGLGAKLATEKANAGKSDPSAAAVFAAIEDKLKITLSDEMQPLASPLGAAYCKRMTTKHDVYIVVCEYASEESAKVGQKKATNDVVKHREVLQTRASTCAVHQVGETKDADAEAKRIRDLFRSL